MKNSKNILIILAFTVAVIACTKKEAPLSPSNKNEFGYTLPQGNSSYAQRIRDYYNRFGVYLLYNFTPKEAYWSITKWDSLYRLIPADSNYVDNQLDLLDTTFFRYYSDSTLREYLPIKFLLCGSIRKSGVGAELDAYVTTRSGSSETGYNYETFIANWGSSRILNINGVKDSAVIFRGNINYSFLRLANLKNQIPRSDLFKSFADYTTPIVNNTLPQRYKRGFLIPVSNSVTPPGESTDWEHFIQAAVQNPYSYLTDASGINASDATFKGILTAVKDSSGLIRKKYDEITDYYKTNYKIDLQRIGNGDK